MCLLQFSCILFCFSDKGSCKVVQKTVPDRLFVKWRYSLDREAAGGSEGQVRLGPGGDVPGAEGGDEIGGRGGREDGEVQPIPRVVKAECDHVSSLVTAGQTLTW